MSYIIEPKAYKKLFMHTLKYSKSDCIGVLLGKKQDKSVIIEDAIPLFHSKVMSGMLEVAFEMIEKTCVTDSRKIVGVYEAPILASGVDIPAPLGINIAGTIKSLGHFTEPCILSINALNVNEAIAGQSASAKYQRLDVQLHAMNYGGTQSHAIVKIQIEGQDFRMIQSQISDKSYLKIVDFDDHFDNVENDWQNPSIA